MKRAIGLSISICLIGLIAVGAWIRRASAEQQKSSTGYVHWTFDARVKEAWNIEQRVRAAQPNNKRGSGNRCPNVKTPLTRAEIDEILRIHNKTRAAVGTPPLKWNCDLANLAQDWANNNPDDLEHRPDNDAGENLAAASNPTTIVELLQQWIDERQDWDGGSKTCKTGEEGCGHYTQMVWRPTTDIGCGLIRNARVLPGDEFDGQTTYLVCNYSPTGNTTGSAPY